MTRSFARFPRHPPPRASRPAPGLRLVWRGVAVCLALSLVTLAAASDGVAEAALLAALNG